MDVASGAAAAAGSAAGSAARATAIFWMLLEGTYEDQHDTVKMLVAEEDAEIKRQKSGAEKGIPVRPFRTVFKNASVDSDGRVSFDELTDLIEENDLKPIEDFKKKEDEEEIEYAYHEGKIVKKEVRRKSRALSAATDAISETILDTASPSLDEEDKKEEVATVELERRKDESEENSKVKDKKEEEVRVELERRKDESEENSKVKYKKEEVATVELEKRKDESEENSKVKDKKEEVATVELERRKDESEENSKVKDKKEEEVEKKEKESKVVKLEKVIDEREEAEKAELETKGFYEAREKFEAEKPVREKEEAEKVKAFYAARKKLEAERALREKEEAEKAAREKELAEKAAHEKEEEEAKMREIAKQEADRRLAEEEEIRREAAEALVQEAERERKIKEAETAAREKAKKIKEEQDRKEREEARKRAEEEKNRKSIARTAKLAQLESNARSIAQQRKSTTMKISDAKANNKLRVRLATYFVDELGYQIGEFSDTLNDFVNFAIEHNMHDVHEIDIYGAYMDEVDAAKHRAINAVKAAEKKTSLAIQSHKLWLKSRGVLSAHHLKRLADCAKAAKMESDEAEKRAAIASNAAVEAVRTAESITKRMSIHYGVEESKDRKKNRNRGMSNLQSLVKLRKNLAEKEIKANSTEAEWRLKEREGATSPRRLSQMKEKWMKQKDDIDNLEMRKSVLLESLDECELKDTKAKRRELLQKIDSLQRNLSEKEVLLKEQEKRRRFLEIVNVGTSMLTKSFRGKIERQKKEMDKKSARQKLLSQQLRVVREQEKNRALAGVEMKSRNYDATAYGNVPLPPGVTYIPKPAEGEQNVISTTAKVEETSIVEKNDVVNEIENANHADHSMEKNLNTVTQMNFVPAATLVAASKPPPRRSSLTDFILRKQKKRDSAEMVEHQSHEDHYNYHKSKRLEKRRNRSQILRNSLPEIVTTPSKMREQAEDEEFEKLEEALKEAGVGNAPPPPPHFLELEEALKEAGVGNSPSSPPPHFLELEEALKDAGVGESRKNDALSSPFPLQSKIHENGNVKFPLLLQTLRDNSSVADHSFSQCQPFIDDHINFEQFCKGLEMIDLKPPPSQALAFDLFESLPSYDVGKMENVKSISLTELRLAICSREPITFRPRHSEGGIEDSKCDDFDPFDDELLATSTSDLQLLVRALEEVIGRNAESGRKIPSFEDDPRAAAKYYARRRNARPAWGSPRNAARRKRFQSSTDGGHHSMVRTKQNRRRQTERRHPLSKTTMNGKTGQPQERSVQTTRTGFDGKTIHRKGSATFMATLHSDVDTYHCTPEANRGLRPSLAFTSNADLNNQAAPKDVEAFLQKAKAKFRAYGYGLSKGKTPNESLFIYLDKNKNGIISRDEFRSILRKLLRCTLGEIVTLEKQIDLNDDGCIDIQEFIKFMDDDSDEDSEGEARDRNKVNLRSGHIDPDGEDDIDVFESPYYALIQKLQDKLREQSMIYEQKLSVTIAEEFEKFDTSKSGYINIAEFKHLLLGLYPLTQEEVAVIFKNVDVTSDTRISLDEFIDFVQGCPVPKTGPDEDMPGKVVSLQVDRMEIHEALKKITQHQKYLPETQREDTARRLKRIQHVVNH
eukprot:g2339.t1